jgi:hypothetical protein
MTAAQREQLAALCEGLRASIADSAAFLADFNLAD